MTKLIRNATGPESLYVDDDAGVKIEGLSDDSVFVEPRSSVIEIESDYIKGVNLRKIKISWIRDRIARIRKDSEKSRMLREQREREAKPSSERQRDLRERLNRLKKAREPRAGKKD